MGWVVKQWRAESLEQLLDDHVREELEAVRRNADRDARRAHRVAERAAREAGARLEALERLGAELHVTVRRQRMAVRDAGVAAAPGEPTEVAPVPPAGSPPPAPPLHPDPLPVPRRRASTRAPAVAVAGIGVTVGDRRPGRASLRSSPLGELFRATDARTPKTPET